MTESLSRLTSMFETAKDLTIEAAVSASARLADTPSSLRPQEISKLLNSRLDKDVLNGMKCVTTMMSRDENALPYFADVVKNITSPSSKVRNLVLIYITRYAEVEPDTALLSINSIQKALSDKDANARANSIKSLSSIRISSIAPILQLCIKRTVTDNSPLVRASTAIAIGKVYEIDPSTAKQLFAYLSKLLADSDPQVVGTTIKAYVKIMKGMDSSQKKWQVIHGHFRRFCKILPQFDEWSQSITIDLLTDYARLFLPKPKLYIKDEHNTIIDLPDNPATIPQVDYEVSFDADLELLIDAMKPLVNGNSSFVVFSIIRSLLALTPSSILQDFNIPSILCSMATNADNLPINLFALQAILLICEHDRNVFITQYKSFYIFPSDSINVAKTKLDILSSLVDESNIKYIIEELKYNALNCNHMPIASESIKAIGRCSQVSTEWNEKILKWCLKNIKNAKGGVLNEFLTVIRYLIQIQQQLKTNDEAVNKEISSIVYNLSLILTDENLVLESDARASIIWIIGEFTKECNNDIAPDILRILIKNFPDESGPVRYQILVLAAKLYSISFDNFKNTHGDVEEFVNTNVISRMFQHVLNLAKYDQSYDTRDRARMFNVLLNSGSDKSELASLFLQVPKPAPIVASLISDNTQSNVLAKYLKVPDWLDPASHPHGDIRKELPIQENNLTSSVSSSVTNSSITKKIGELPNTMHSISSQQYHNQNVKSANPSYQLQSLDEFFGSEEDEVEDDYESDSDEEVDSSEEDEDDNDEYEDEEDDDQDIDENQDQDDEVDEDDDDEQLESSVEPSSDDEPSSLEQNPLHNKQKNGIGEHHYVDESE